MTNLFPDKPDYGDDDQPVTWPWFCLLLSGLYTAAILVPIPVLLWKWVLS